MPRVDWPKIKTGEKTELRSQGRHAVQRNVLSPPEPIVGYCFIRHRAEAEARLFVAEDCWTEPLGSIDRESLAHEGFDSMADFKRYWKGRFRVYKPLNEIQVVQLRPWQPHDERQCADALMTRLYGRWL